MFGRLQFLNLFQLISKYNNSEWKNLNIFELLAYTLQGKVSMDNWITGKFLCGVSCDWNETNTHFINYTKFPLPNFFLPCTSTGIRRSILSRVWTCDVSCLTPNFLFLLSFLVLLVDCRTSTSSPAISVPILWWQCCPSFTHLFKANKDLLLQWWLAHIWVSPVRRTKSISNCISKNTILSLQTVYVS